MFRREFIVPLWTFELPDYLRTRKADECVESSAKINGNDTAQAVPLRFVRGTWTDCRVSCAGHRRAARTASDRAGHRSFFSWAEACRIHYSGVRQVFRLDVWLVPPHRHSRKRCFLLCDFLVARLLSGPWPVCVGPDKVSRRGLRFDAGVIDRRGAQLSQECPHLSTTSGNKQPRGTMSLSAAVCSDWARLCK